MTQPYTNKLKVAVVGLGQVALLFDEEPKRQKSGEIWTHLSAYLKLQDLYEVVAAVDTDPSKFHVIKKRISGIKCFLSIEEMLDNIDIDVVSVCTPDLSHLQCLRALVGRVRGIFLEKPVCGIGEIEEASSFISEFKKTKTTTNEGRTKERMQQITHDRNNGQTQQTRQLEKETQLQRKHRKKQLTGQRIINERATERTNEPTHTHQ